MTLAQKMQGAPLVRTLILGIALAALPSPAAARDAQGDGLGITGGDSGEVRVLCVRWNADTETPEVYDPIEGQGCAVAARADIATDPPEHSALRRLDHAIRQLQADLDALRLTTEAPDPAPLRWQITAASPNHLYYAAYGLLRNRNGVAGSTRGACLASDAREKNAATLDVVIDAVACVNNRLRRGSALPPEPARAAPPQQATDESALQMAARLLERLMATGRQLDAAQSVETTPNDIYDRLEDAAGDLAGLAGSLPSLPAASKQAKNVADIYRLVFRCLRLSQVLEVKQNLETRRRGGLALSQWHGVDVAPNSPSLQFDTAADAGSAAVDLADVYDLATLLAAQTGAISGASDAVYSRPREATLSDVFGLASALEARLMKMTGITGRR